MRVGTICYATEQGIGYLPKQFYDAGVITDVMIFRHGSRKNQYGWYPPNTNVLVGRPFNGPAVEAFLRSVEVMLFFETPFDWTVLNLCRQLGTKTVVVPMYECTPVNLPAHPDKWICPSLLDQRDYFPGSPFLQIPVPDEAIAGWKQRTQAKRFLHNGGHLGLRGHKGTLEILQAMQHVKSSMILHIRSQDRIGLENIQAQAGFVKSSWDYQVAFNYGSIDRKNLFMEHDVFIMAEKYNGLSLPLSEARAAGMVVMTSDRFPMNTWLPTGPLIPVESYSRQRVSGAYREYDEAKVNPQAIAAKIDEVFELDEATVTQYSIEGREWAEANSWFTLKNAWMEELAR